LSLSTALDKLRADRPRAALPLLEAHVAAYASDAHAWFLVGACRHQLGDAAGALQAFERVLALSPGPNAAYASAVALEDLGRLDEALASYDAALNLLPGHEDALHNRGLLLARLGRLDEAERNHRHYVELHPDSLRAHGDLADILLALSRYEEAVAELDWILAREPRDAIALLKRGVALASVRRFDESRMAIGAALAADRLAVARFIRNLAPQTEPEVMLTPENIFLWRRYAAQGACDWTAWEGYLDEFRRAIGNPALPLDRALAFTALHLPLDESERHELAAHCRANRAKGRPPARARRGGTHAPPRRGPVAGPARAPERLLVAAPGGADRPPTL
jgi:tetratricopeptide (TPR) repeat protein